MGKIVTRAAPCGQPTAGESSAAEATSAPVSGGEGISTAPQATAGKA